MPDIRRGGHSYNCNGQFVVPKSKPKFNGIILIPAAVFMEGDAAFISSKGM